MAPATKKSVSIAGIFKQRGGFKHHTKAIKKPINPSKSSASKKHNNTREHPLAAAFNGSIEYSRATIHENALTAIESTHHMLTARLASASAQSSSIVQEATVTNEELLRPLAKEQLQFKSHDGKPSGVASLGDRMKRFKKTVAFHEKEHTALWKEWTEVQQEILELGKEVLGPKGLEALLTHGVDEPEGYRGEAQVKMEDEVNAERARLAEEVEKMSKGFIEKMRADEKEMDLRLKKQQKNFLEALNTEI